MYAGTSGNTHGERNDSNPARNATKIVGVMAAPPVGTSRKRPRLNAHRLMACREGTQDGNVSVQVAPNHSLTCGTIRGSASTSSNRPMTINSTAVVVLIAGR